MRVSTKGGVAGFNLGSDDTIPLGDHDEGFKGDLGGVDEEDERIDMAERNRKAEDEFHEEWEYWCNKVL